MKKSVLVTLAALLFLLAVNVSSAVAGQLTVGFSNRTLDGPFFQALSAAIEEKGKALGYKMILTDARTDFTKQIADVEDMLVQDIDYLILNPQDPKASMQIVKRAQAAGVPVIIIDMSIGPAAGVLTRITGNNVDGNILIGEYAVEQAANKPIKLSLVSFQPGVIVTVERRDSFLAGIVSKQLRDKGAAKLDILTETFAGGTDEGGLKCVEDILTAFPETNTLYTDTSLQLRGMINALKAAGRQDIKIYSFDGAKFEYDYIKSGDLAATGENSPFKLADMAFDVIAQHRDGERVFPFHMAPKGLCVNKSNVEEAYGDGF